MFGIDDQQGLIDDLAIGGHLPGQALESVSLCLDFDATDVPVDHSNVDPAVAVIEAEFVDDQSIGTGSGVRQQPPIGGLPDITVSKPSQSHPESIAVVIAEWQRSMLRRACHDLSDWECTVCWCPPL
ncbi:hypothetical protein A8V01_24345 [Novosphingobium guangzhouense]|uniref:Uncharacterized protein n=1 Tax=Novosphingobium guangzhouense TaxID=1850347 RepID=A0A2K2FWM5_9SPHN|nr:hypothetical protein A8V01_24345 [Novosphingobium guangzhouense]PZU66877.1 MAG: hypothetical protein DI540_12230 [Sphingobium sp.]